MKRKNNLIVFLSVLAFVAVFAAFAQQKSDETAVDPVCGMTVVKANAKATYEYNGMTYYFCSTGCKESFAKEPEKYLKKEAEKKPTAMTGMQHQAPAPKSDKPHQMHEGAMGGHMAMMGMEEGMSCPFYAKDVEMMVEKTSDGVTIKITSQNPESVKAIQEHAAKMQEMKKDMGKDMEAGACPGCPDTCPMKKRADK